jgi:hypothetical protein
MLETSTNGAVPADEAAAGREDQRAVGELGFGAGERGCGQRCSIAAMIRVESPIDRPSIVSTGAVDVSPVRRFVSRM